MRNPKTPIKEVLRSYLLSTHDIETGTADWYRGYIVRYANWLEAQGRDATIEHLEAELVNAFLGELKRSVSPQTKKPYSSGTIRGAWAGLQSFSKYLAGIELGRDALKRHALANVLLPKLKETSRDALSADQVKRLLQASRQGPCGHRNFALVYVAGGLGLRRRELIGLEIRDIDWDARRVRVRKEIAKNGRERQVALGQDVAAVLDEYLHSADRPLTPETPVFLLNDGGRITASSIKRLFTNMVTVTGIHVSPHHLRHTWATNFRKANPGSDLLDLKRQGGWKDMRMVELYAHDYESTSHPRQSPMSVLSGELIRFRQTEKSRRVA